MSTATLSGYVPLLEEESLSRPWLAARLGISSARLDGLRRGGEVFGVRPSGRREHLYPSWQFGADGRPLASIPRLLRAARESGLGDVELYGVLRRREGLTGTGSLVDALREGREKHVLAAVRAAGN